MKKCDKQIQEIVKFFDWQKVHKTMTALNWTWGDDKNVPGIGELVQTAVSLLDTVAEGDGKYSSSSTGGFVASIEDGNLDLSFVVCSWCAEKGEK